MKKLVTILFICWTTTIVGQAIDKGIYRGHGLPFTVCYLTIGDTIKEVEYFYSKGSQIFAHNPSKQLEITFNSHPRASILKSQDDSIQVFIRRNKIRIKRKGFEHLEVVKSSDTYEEINTLRNRHLKFNFSQQLHRELIGNNKMDSQLFWEKWNSFNLQDYYFLNQKEFGQKLEQAKEEILKN